MEMKRMLYKMNVNDVDDGIQNYMVLKISNITIHSNHTMIKPSSFKTSPNTKRIKSALEKSKKKIGKAMPKEDMSK